MHTRTLPLFLLGLFATPGCFTPADDDAPFDDATSSASGASATDPSGESDPSGDAATDPDSAESSPTDPEGDGDSSDGATDQDSSDTQDDADSSTSDASDTGTGEAESGDTSATTDASETEATTDDDETTDTGLPVEDRLVFVTSTGFVQMTLPNASDACQELADEAGLAGTYLAWVSHASFEPADDFDEFDGPYVLVDGSIVADDWSDLVDGTLDHAIDLDENGDEIDHYAWTNTDDDGTILHAGAVPQNCTAFTSNDPFQAASVGSTTAADSDWTDSGVLSCVNVARFYCFEQ